jgi:hypothetical protein
MKKISLFGLILIGLFCCSLTFAQKKSGPPVPFVDRGACPFECCTYRGWSANKSTLVRKAMTDASPVAFRLARGEKVVGVTGVVITTQPGILRALKPGTLGNTKIRRGDEFFLLTNLGEGFSKVWYKGRVIEAEPYDESAFKVIRQRKSVWWVKIRDRRGRIGWSREPDNFDNKDQCGG